MHYCICVIINVWSAFKYASLFTFRINAFTPGYNKLCNVVKKPASGQQADIPKATHFTHLHSPNLHLQKDTQLNYVLVCICDMWAQPLQLWKQSTDVVSVEAVWERRNTNVMKTNTALFTMSILSRPLPSQIVYLTRSPPNSKRFPRATPHHFFYKFCNHPANRQENRCYQTDQHWKSYFVVVTFKNYSIFHTILFMCRETKGLMKWTNWHEGQVLHSHKCFSCCSQ